MIWVCLIHLRKNWRRFRMVSCDCQNENSENNHEKDRRGHSTNSGYPLFFADCVFVFFSVVSHCKNLLKSEIKERVICAWDDENNAEDENNDIYRRLKSKSERNILVLLVKSLSKILHFCEQMVLKLFQLTGVIFIKTVTIILMRIDSLKWIIWWMTWKKSF